MRLAANRVLNPEGYSHEKNPPPPQRTDSRLPYYLPGRADYGNPGGVERSRLFFAGDHRDTPLDFLVPDGPDGFTGVFLRRAEKGTGAVSAHGVTVVWDLAASESIADASKAQVRAFGLQMVYVAEGAFYLGSGGTEANAFYAYTEDHRSSPPYRVTSAGTIPTGRQGGKLWARKSAQPEDGGEISAAFPNGYAAFYCMKNLITSRQYAGFLETLPVAQAEERYGAGNKWIGPNFGYTGRCHTQVMRKGEPPNYTYSFLVGDPRSGAGCFGMSWADGAAYAAWAGLRPMTELELEKAVRGPRAPIPEECCACYWGLDVFSSATWHAFKGHEVQGERTVTVGNAKGRGFKGTHGDGTPALPPDWPQADAVGSGFRVTHFQSTELDLARTLLSDRLIADTADPRRLMSYKWRGVRTAP